MEKYRITVLGIEEDGTTHLLHGVQGDLDAARLWAAKQERSIYSLCVYTHYVIQDDHGAVVEVRP